jgi:hypothetical protein
MRQWNPARKECYLNPPAAPNSDSSELDRSELKVCPEGRPRGQPLPTACLPIGRAGRLSVRLSPSIELRALSLSKGSRRSQAQAACPERSRRVLTLFVTYETLKIVRI